MPCNKSSARLLFAMSFRSTLNMLTQIRRSNASPDTQSTVVVNLTNAE